MSSILNTIGTVGIFVFVFSSMLAIGVGYTVQEIVVPLRNGRLLLLTLIANFVILPLGSVAIGIGLRLEKPLATGLALLGAVSGTHSSRSWSNTHGVISNLLSAQWFYW